MFTFLKTKYYGPIFNLLQTYKKLMFFFKFLYSMIRHIHLSSSKLSTK